MSDAERQRRFLTVLLAAAIFLAPLLALLLRVEAGLLAMAVALTATALLLRDAAPDAPRQLHQPLRLLVGVNLALAVACLVALAWLVVRP